MAAGFRVNNLYMASLFRICNLNVHALLLCAEMLTCSAAFWRHNRLSRLWKQNLCSWSKSADRRTNRPGAAASGSSLRTTRSQSSWYDLYA